MPGVNIGTDAISPGEGGSDDKINGSKVLPSNPPSTEILMYKKYLESKQKQKEEKKKKRNRNIRKKAKNKKIEIKQYFFLLQRTGLEN